MLKMSVKSVQTHGRTDVFSVHAWKC
jgi:hypothetical protein